MADLSNGLIGRMKRKVVTQPVARSLGITARKTIDTWIATSCLEKGLALLYSDKDFDPFVEHLGLQSAVSGT
jgi:predicted nucleic acid-binding protein